jgi:hypothetical protein
MKNTNKTVTDYIKEFFELHPNEEIKHDKVVDYVFKFIPKARDPWRAIRKLYQEGWLIQVRKGVYKRIPGYKGHNVLAPFPPEVKEAIFKRDNYRCVVCGNGLHNGYEICADHITPQAKGGKSTLENGQTLCSEYNLMKKRYGVIDFLKKYCEKTIERAKQYEDSKTEKMFKEILGVLKKYESS